MGEIVGVVGNVRYQSLAEEEEPTFYWPEAQRPLGNMFLVVRTEGRSEEWVNAVRGAVRSVDPSVPVADVETLASVVALASARTRFSLTLLGTSQPSRFCLPPWGSLALWRSRLRNGARRSAFGWRSGRSRLAFWRWSSETG